MTFLTAGDAFPTLTITTPDGRALTLPDELAGRYGVILFSRGARCRSCVEQLRAFQRALARLSRAGVAVAVLTADDESTAAALIEQYGLTYPIGYGADVRQVAEATGAFVALEPPTLQTTGFVIGATGEVIVSVYSCGALGRLLPDDVLDLVHDLTAENAPAASG